ncbi:MAG: peptidoglycan DD-metalloendopeptidase family protein [Candidatus Eisenbacteria sp.]|nr:peptidoglycan DD-metalloendopeptidase family protein [Candidatus Eisenbacteria bacterium]
MPRRVPLNLVRPGARRSRRSRRPPTGPGAQRKQYPRRSRALLCGAGLIVLATLTLGLAAPWVAASDPNQGIAGRRAELEDLKRRIEQKRRQVAELRAEGEDIERILAEVERERGMTERYLEKVRRQETQLGQRIRAQQECLAEKEGQRETARQEMAAALVHYYKERRVTAAELLVSSVTFSQLFARAHYWVRMIRRLRGQLEDLLAQHAAIRAELKEIETRRREVRGLRHERQQQLEHLTREEAARRTHREELQRTVARFEEQTRKLLASQAEIERLIEAALRAPAAGIDADLASHRGRVPWPLTGRVMTRFGTQVHPRYGTKVENKGIEIAAAEGTPIQAVAGGRVVFDGWLGGYGRTVVVAHGDQLFTLYAHASEVLVGRGDDVAAGQTIARVGASDSLIGPALYFEIRQGARAVDPLRWLAARSSPR